MQDQEPPKVHKTTESAQIPDSPPKELASVPPTIPSLMKDVSVSLVSTSTLNITSTEMPIVEGTPAVDIPEKNDIESTPEKSHIKTEAVVTEVEIVQVSLNDQVQTPIATVAEAVEETKEAIAQPFLPDTKESNKINWWLILGSAMSVVWWIISALLGVIMWCLLALVKACRTMAAKDKKTGPCVLTLDKGLAKATQGEPKDKTKPLEDQLKFTSKHSRTW